MCAQTLYRPHHPHATPPTDPTTLAALEVFRSIEGFQCVPKPSPTALATPPPTTRPTLTATASPPPRHPPTPPPWPRLQARSRMCALRPHHPAAFTTPHHPHAPAPPPPRHPHTNPTTLAALASVLEVFKGFQMCARPHATPPPTPSVLEVF